MGSSNQRKLISFRRWRSENTPTVKSAFYLHIIEPKKTDGGGFQRLSRKAKRRKRKKTDKKNKP